MKPERLGDGAIRWPRDPDADPRALLDALRAVPDVVDAIVSEHHAMVTFDPSRPPDAPWAVAVAASSIAVAREHVVRARYDGPDLDHVASALGVTRAAAIEIHASCTYIVRMIGFLPGFAYLGGGDPRLALPRRGVPRARVDAGSIGVAAGYTAIYPFASPGGWHLVARAIDFVPFDAAHGARFALGDRVRFEPTS